MNEKDIDRGYEARKPLVMLRDDRSVIRYFIYGILTCGIYAIYALYTLIRDINTLCKESGRKVPGLLTVLLLSIVTALSAKTEKNCVLLLLQDQSRTEKKSSNFSELNN